MAVVLAVGVENASVTSAGSRAIITNVRS